MLGQGGFVPGPAGFRIEGAGNEESGWSVSGDIDGDGLDDFVIGASSAYVVFGIPRGDS